MVRIGGSTEKGKSITEWNYYNSAGEFRVDKEGSPVLLNCLMYKMCYYRFGQIYTEGGKIVLTELQSVSLNYNSNSYLIAFLNRQTVGLRQSQEYGNRKQGL